MSHAQDVAKYMQGVRSGKIVAGRLLKAAVERQYRDLESAGRQRAKYWFDQAAADRVINFIANLKHSTGEFAGEPFLLLPWQKFVVSVLFGWKRKSDGMRRFREAFISLGRGNGKSPLAAALLLYLLCADVPIEPRAEIKIAATERGKRTDNGGAMIVFNECARFIEQNPALKKRCQILSQSILYLPTEGTISPLGKEAQSKDGFNLHAYVADELHEWQKQHQGVWDKLETAMGKRRQPLAISITTAGSDRSELWRRKYNEACKVVTGVYADEQMFVAIYQVDTAEDGGPADDPFDNQASRIVWPKANPNLGVSVKPDHLERMTAKARHDPDARHNLLRYHLNVMVRSKLKIVEMGLWNACGAQPLPDLSRLVCHGGIDLGWRDDLASFYLVFPLHGQSDTRYATLGWNWICEQTPHRDLDREPWASWIDSGKLIVTPGEVFDPSAILAKVRQVRKLYRLQTVALDPNNARSLEVSLVNDHGIEVYAYGQTAKKFNEPLRTLLDTIKSGDLLHGADPLLAWAMSNMVVRKDVAGLMMPDKSSSDEKIDPAVALLMGFSECLYAGRIHAETYNERGLRRLRNHT